MFSLSSESLEREKMSSLQLTLPHLCELFVGVLKQLHEELKSILDQGRSEISDMFSIATFEGVMSVFIRRKEELESLNIKWNRLSVSADDVNGKIHPLEEQVSQPPLAKKQKLEQEGDQVGRTTHWLLKEQQSLIDDDIKVKEMCKMAAWDVYGVVDGAEMRILTRENEVLEMKRSLAEVTCNITIAMCERAIVEVKRWESEWKQSTMELKEKTEVADVSLGKDGENYDPFRIFSWFASSLVEEIYSRDIRKRWDLILGKVPESASTPWETPTVKCYNIPRAPLCTLAFQNYNNAQTFPVEPSPSAYTHAEELPPANEFEKRATQAIIPANKIDVTFDDIGGLDEIKESLRESVLLPFRRPELFKGGLLKPCRGILLFGPPGTGKTMLAKAIAKEAGANFMNVSMSTISTKRYGEREKIMGSLFSVAAKVSPTIIFVDDVDSMLVRESGITAEFKNSWDEFLLTKSCEKVLVLAATSRPFDLDKAIIRYFERRIMVGIPSLKGREKILRTLLAKERVNEMLSFEELAAITEGYSGRDLEILCRTAVCQTVREVMKKERLKDKGTQQKAEGNQKIDGGEVPEGDKGHQGIILRPVNMKDFKQATCQVPRSFAEKGFILSELEDWNDLYGEGGRRRKQSQSYLW